VCRESVGRKHALCCELALNSFVVKDLGMRMDKSFFFIRQVILLPAIDTIARNNVPAAKVLFDDLCVSLDQLDVSLRLRKTKDVLKLDDSACLLQVLSRRSLVHREWCLLVLAAYSHQAFARQRRRTRGCLEDGGETPTNWSLR
jgi:hypothetical protein